MLKGRRGFPSQQFNNVFVMNCRFFRKSYEFVFSSAIRTSKVEFILLNLVSQNWPKMLGSLKEWFTPTDAVFHCLVVGTSQILDFNEPNARKMYTKYRKTQTRLRFGVPHLAEVWLAHMFLKPWVSQEKATQRGFATFSFPCFRTTLRTWLFNRIALHLDLLFLCASI